MSTASAASSSFMHHLHNISCFSCSRLLTGSASRVSPNYKINYLFASCSCYNASVCAWVLFSRGGRNESVSIFGI
jgi:hypothetical protein